MDKEYTKGQMEEVRQNQEMRSDIKYIRDEVINIKNSIQKDYVTRDQFEPIQKIVYGLVGTILFAVVGALLALVIIK